MQPKQEKKVKTKLETQFKQILRVADLNPNKYEYIKYRSLYFNSLTELSVEDLIRIGITDEAERNALLSRTKMMLGPNNHLMNSHPFDIQKTVESRTSIVLLAHIDLMLMIRDFEKMLDDLKRHIVRKPLNAKFRHTPSSASLHFLKLTALGLYILENDFSMMLDSLDKNKKSKDCRSNQMILCVASSVLLTAIIGGFLVKRFLW